MDNKLIGSENNIVFYEDENNNTKVEVRLQDEDVWLNVNAIANLFNVQRPAITKHINNIYNDEELEGNRKVTRKREYYNLDMIISIGFRVNSKTAIKFRTWANKLIKEYIDKIFTGGVYSYQENLIKPDTSIYELIINRYKLKKG